MAHGAAAPDYARQKNRCNRRYLICKISIRGSSQPSPSSPTSPGSSVAAKTASSASARTPTAWPRRWPDLSHAKPQSRQESSQPPGAAGNLRRGAIGEPACGETLRARRRHDPSAPPREPKQQCRPSRPVGKAGRRPRTRRFDRDRKGLPYRPTG